MLIAIDYDGTYDEDPELWEIFAATAKLKGHEVICVTCRHIPPEVYEPQPSFKIYCTENKFKKQFIRDLGLEVDVWIDDLPETISDSKIFNFGNK